MGHTANMIIKDIIHIFVSISKYMRILLMRWHYREPCTWLLMLMQDCVKFKTFAAIYMSDDSVYKYLI